MVATAPPTQRWLLLEVPRAWPDKILKSPEVAGWVPQLNAIVQSRSGRVLFIRRPGRSESHEAPRAFVVVDALSRTQTAGTWLPGTASRPADLRAAVAAFDADVPLTDPSPARLLVCAHGMHDQCCAVRGRPVASVLAQTWPTEVWECSHLGGDRFGANILVLPDGTYFGRLDDISGPKVIAKHLAGTERPTISARCDDARPPSPGRRHGGAADAGPGPGISPARTDRQRRGSAHLDRQRHRSSPRRRDPGARAAPRRPARAPRLPRDRGQGRGDLRDQVAHLTSTPRRVRETRRVDASCVGVFPELDICRVRA